MNFFGKLLGAFFGYLLAGPIGLLFGFLIGNFFDRGLKFSIFNMRNVFLRQGSSQKQFFEATFLVMGYLAKADGRVSEQEIQMARVVMNHMNLNESLKKEAIQLFNRGKQADFDIISTLKALRVASFNNALLLQIFVDIQVKAAASDGPINPKEAAALHFICEQLQVQTPFYTNEQAYQQQNHFYNSPSSSTSIQSDYQELGITANASDEDVKKAYRRLISQNHPDKLVAKGLPEAMIKIANEKTQRIRKAYEHICQARGIK